MVVFVVIGCCLLNTGTSLYFTEPEVQEKMQSLLETNPDNLDEVIEQDPDLKALRDSNPLCAELMKDPGKYNH
jgi:hypothetical protein